ncbi:MAG: hypothetical protein CBD29_05855 [Synechococcus sp. TMED169]|jgi:hypothetical protein|nr:MAG: hypothetical protein CBD29_05855 [Synechococcus sp. TMED169]|tara:strand:- start:428 stop:613 length:186 start_codon:yes stop_codon:yes gene_type:complete
MTFNRSGEAELRLLVSPRAFSIMRIQAIDSLNICAAVRWPRRWQVDSVGVADYLLSDHQQG